MNFLKPSSRDKVFSEYVSRYDAWYEKHPILYKSELNLVSSLWKKGKTSLEIGVGTGRFAEPLGICFGLDPSFEMLKKAKERGIKTVKGIGEKLPFLDCSFDSLLIAITICFVEDPIRVLQESYRVLKPGGMIVIAFIDRISPWGEYYSEKSSPFYKIARFFSVEEVEKMLKKAGFKVIEKKQSLFLKPGEKEKLEDPIDGTGKGSFIGISGEKPVN